MSIVIDSTYNGPDGIGNGGYCCGRFAQALIEQSAPTAGAAIEVTLRKPVPLNTPLDTEPQDQGIAVHCSQMGLVATVQHTTLSLSPGPAPDMAVATDAAKHYIGFEHHPYPRCFVCGPQRRCGDGLQIYPGQLDDQALVAAPWQPYPALADDNGLIKPEFIWAALDCPSYFGVLLNTQRDDALLGRMSLMMLETAIPVDQRYIITAWPVSSQGRKHCGGAALFSEQGTCLAQALGVWITLGTE